MDDPQPSSYGSSELRGRFRGLTGVVVVLGPSRSSPLEWPGAAAKIKSSRSRHK